MKMKIKGNSDRIETHGAVLKGYPQTTFAALRLLAFPQESRACALDSKCTLQALY